ncbi:hypothetical protein [Streptomyces cavernicola]|uniref:Uncharacterized protein n=1 Tax=Streptomyces cavernicola TaxID=3043613 RepID=A0ABT6S569_9ACTN|nr:hypothetical protein [Streptomyces sp. B-S-A6]MDI3403170.1 hypothetical protein [Streptomyces sp. B-S-A6]
MTEPIQPPHDSAPGRQLQERTDGIPGMLEHAQDIMETWDVPVDFSPASLLVLEALLLDLYSAGPALNLDDATLRAAAAYLGESLAHVTGWEWAWSTSPAGSGQPVVHPDADLDPIAPYALMTRALTARTGTAFAVEARRLRNAMAAAGRPVAGPEPDPQLEEWLAEREADFPAWAEEAGGAADRWDFGVASLDDLAAVLRSRYGSNDALTEASEAGTFVDGAIWYAGEVARHTKGAVWHAPPSWDYEPDDDEADAYDKDEDLWYDSPFVKHPDRYMPVTDIPMACFHLVVSRADKNLRTWLNVFE